MLRRIARADKDYNYDAAIKNLKDSNYWKNHKELRDWFSNTWLKHVKVIMTNSIFIVIYKKQFGHRHYNVIQQKNLLCDFYITYWMQ